MYVFKFEKSLNITMAAARKLVLHPDIDCNPNLQVYYNYGTILFMPFYL